MDNKTVIFDGITSGNKFLSVENDHTLTLGSQMTVEGGRGFVGRGTFTNGTDTVINQGLISANTPSTSIEIRPDIFINEGIVEARNGGKLLFPTNSSVANLSGTTFSGGSWEAFVGSTIDFDYGFFDTNGAQIVLSGAGSSFTVTTLNTPIEDTLTSNIVGGSLRLLEGRDFSTIADFTNSGGLAVSQGSVLDVNGDYLQTITGVTTGAGTVVANMVESSGVVGPGASTGELTIDTDYIQTADGRLMIEIGGDDIGVDSDLLTITGDAFLDGDLIVAVVGGFAPAPSDVFTILEVTGGGSIIDGVFANALVTVPVVCGGRFGSGTFDVIYTSTQVQLTNFVSIPSSILGDLDCDDDVDIDDLAILVGFWLSDEVSVDIGPGPGDNFIDFIDFSVLADGWLASLHDRPVATSTHLNDRRVSSPDSYPDKEIGRAT